MIEIFKTIEGYEGLYEVSNLGNVRSLGMWANTRNGGKRFIKGRVLKPAPDNYGYLIVNLCKDGKRKTCKVHRIVAQTFLSNPKNLPEVNHKDEDKTNNRVENLEWCDSKYNVNYGTRNEKAAEKLKEKMKGMFINRTDLSQKVQAFNKDGVLIFEFPSAAEAGRNGFNQGHISACCRGKYKTAYGYIWKYA